MYCVLSTLINDVTYFLPRQFFPILIVSENELYHLTIKSETIIPYPIVVLVLLNKSKETTDVVPSLVYEEINCFALIRQVYGYQKHLFKSLNIIDKNFH